MNVGDELRKIQDLYDHGALTEEEYTQAKALVLGSAAPAARPSAKGPELDLGEPEEALTPGRLRSMQIIAAVLPLGVVVFLVICLFLVQNNGQGLAPPQNGVPVVSLIALILLAGTAPLAYLLPPLITRNIVQGIHAASSQQSGAFETAEAKLLPVKQTTMIIALALLEGAAFLGCNAYLLEGQPLALVVVIVALLLMLIQFPTRTRVQAWLRRQTDLLAEMRLRD